MPEWKRGQCYQKRWQSEIPWYCFWQIVIWQGPYIMGCKARKGINVLKVIACANMHQRVLLILYQTLILSLIDYGFGLFTLSKTQLKRLEVIQNQDMRTILGWTRDTSCEAMRHWLGLLSMPERNKKAQVQAYLKVSGDFKHPIMKK